MCEVSCSTIQVCIICMSPFLIERKCHCKPQLCCKTTGLVNLLKVLPDILRIIKAGVRDQHRVISAANLCRFIHTFTAFELADTAGMVMNKVWLVVNTGLWWCNGRLLVGVRGPVVFTGACGTQPICGIQVSRSDGYR
jgi:hypothetical protein